MPSTMSWIVVAAKPAGRARQAFVTPRAGGVARRAAGVVAGGDRGALLLREAIEAFERGDARLERARALAELASQGLTNREIAQTLFITAHAVEGHLTSVFRKLRLDSRTELAAALAEEIPVMA